MKIKAVSALLALVVLLASLSGSTSAVVCSGVAGDANNDGNVNLIDAVFVYAYLFQGGDAPPCPEQADANGDCNINLIDYVYLYVYLFQGGNPPVFCN
ncbi:MAG: dockerin type I repeat-containing protein [Candidatus Zixiibacteriota bacterium]